ADRKNSAAAFRSLEAEFADLCRDEHQATEAAAAKAKARIAEVEAGIEDICKLAYPEDSDIYLYPIGECAYVSASTSYDCCESGFVRPETQWNMLRSAIVYSCGSAR